MSQNRNSYKKFTYAIGKEEDGKCVKEILRKKLHLSRGEISHAKGEEDGILLNAKRVTVAHPVQERFCLQRENFLLCMKMRILSV